MAHVAREMERQGLLLPLLIGGATTSKAHTAVKIAPAYRQPVVHVLDASRAVPVVSSLISVEQKPNFTRELKAEYDRIRSQHGGQTAKLISLADARARAARLNFDDLPQPEFIGVRALSAATTTLNTQHTARVTLAELVPFIDWSPFFHAWELRGRYPAILNHEKHGDEARKLFADAQVLLERMVTQKRLQPRAVYGLFPANAIGDDVELYTGPARTDVLQTFHFLRQQIIKDDGSPNWCLADFIAPRTGGRPDHLGGFAVTTGHGLAELVKEFKADHDDYNAIMAEALADRLAEAFAEYLHKRVREEWGFGRLEKLTTDELIAEQYRGIRPAAGYPASPDHTEKGTLWKLLDVEQHTGIKLTESYAMWPGSSVSGLYFAHPDSKYFAVGKLGRDQLLDYHRRKGLTLQEVERWLGPYLNYEPGPAALGCACGVAH
jgi:5-methyltetrahydrofolate--homocysteine methyltransferase